MKFLVQQFHRFDDDVRGDYWEDEEGLTDIANRPKINPDDAAPGFEAVKRYIQSHEPRSGKYRILLVAESYDFEAKLVQKVDFEVTQVLT